jgi:predicted O-methyltransferase YrrM
MTLNSNQALAWIGVLGALIGAGAIGLLTGSPWITGTAIILGITALVVCIVFYSFSRMRALQALTATLQQVRAEMLVLPTLRAELHRLRAELRYLVDAADEEEDPRTTEEDNALANYALTRRIAHRRTVAFARVVKEAQIRELYLEEIFPQIGREQVHVGSINELTGHPNKVDLMFVCAIAKHRRASSIFEFGTYIGRTAYHLTFSSPNAHVTTLNLPPAEDPRYGRYIGRMFKGTDRERFITQIFEDSRKFDTTPLRNSFDFVFVDGDHAYELVKNDTRKAFELLKPGGIIIWHDFAPKSEGVVQFFQKFTASRPLFRIKRTCLLMHIDGVNPATFAPHPLQPSLELEAAKMTEFSVEDVYHQ